jgi:predicted RNase H-like nuclease
MSRQRIRLSYTPSEWKILEQSSKELGYKNVRHFLNAHLHKMSEKLSEITPQICYCERTSIEIDIPKHLTENIGKISEKHCANIGHLISKFIVNPALKSFYEKNGY